MKLSCEGMSMCSDVWQATANFLFGDRVNGDFVRNRVTQPVQFGCMHCGKKFTSLVTPVRCPHCGGEPDERGIMLTHKGHTARTFAFCIGE